MGRPRWRAEARSTPGSGVMMCGSRDSSAFVNAVWITPCHAVGATYVTPDGSDASKARYWSRNVSKPCSVRSASTYAIHSACIVAVLVPRHLVDEVASRRDAARWPLRRVTPVGPHDVRNAVARAAAPPSPPRSPRTAPSDGPGQSPAVISLRMTASHSAGRRLRLSSSPIAA